MSAIRYPQMQIGHVSRAPTAYRMCAADCETKMVHMTKSLGSSVKVK